MPQIYLCSFQGCKTKRQFWDKLLYTGWCVVVGVSRWFCPPHMSQSNITLSSPDIFFHYRLLCRWVSYYPPSKQLAIDTRSFDQPSFIISQDSKIHSLQYLVIVSLSFWLKGDKHVVGASCWLLIGFMKMIRLKVDTADILLYIQLWRQLFEQNQIKHNPQSLSWPNAGIICQKQVKFIKCHQQHVSSPSPLLSSAMLTATYSGNGSPSKGNWREGGRLTFCIYLHPCLGNFIQLVRRNTNVCTQNSNNSNM